jgi:hypothetical protein
MEGFLRSFVICHRLLSFDLPGRIPKLSSARVRRLRSSSTMTVGSYNHIKTDQHQRPRFSSYARGMRCVATAGTSASPPRNSAPAASARPELGRLKDGAAFIDCGLEH